MPASQHFLAAAPGRNQTDANLDQTHVGLRVRLYSITMEQNFQTTSECHTGWRTDHGEGRVFECLVGILAGFNRFRDLGPARNIGCKQGKADIGADRKVGCLAVDNQRLVILRRDYLQYFFDHGHDARIDAVHFGMKLETDNPIPDIPQTSRTVTDDTRSRAFNVLQQEHAIWPGYVVIGVIGSKILQHTLFCPIERTVSDLVQQLWHGHTGFAQLCGEPVRSELVDHLEWSPFPGISVSHGLVDRIHIVGYLGYQRSGVAQCVGEYTPGVSATFVRVLYQSAQALATGADTVKVCFPYCPIFACFEVQRLFDSFSVGTVEAVKTTFTFAAGITLTDHTCYQFGFLVQVSEHILFGQRRQHRGRYMRLQINTHQVHQAKHACFRYTHGPADNGVCFFN